MKRTRVSSYVLYYQAVLDRVAVLVSRGGMSLLFVEAFVDRLHTPMRNEFQIKKLALMFLNVRIG